jgi:hypothetical protein
MTAETQAEELEETQEKPKRFRKRAMFLAFCEISTVTRFLKKWTLMRLEFCKFKEPRKIL